MKHTPGKWYASTTGDQKGLIAAVYDKRNAALIAAAPELLEACKMAKKYLEPNLVEPGRTVFWRLVSAIRKAEGVQDETDN